MREVFIFLLSNEENLWHLYLLEKKRILKKTLQIASKNSVKDSFGTEEIL